MRKSSSVKEVLRGQFPGETKNTRSRPVIRPDPYPKESPLAKSRPQNNLNSLLTVAVPDVVTKNLKQRVFLVDASKLSGVRHRYRGSGNLVLETPT